MSDSILPFTESLSVEFKSDRKRLPDNELIEALPPLSAQLSGWRYRLNSVQRERYGIHVPRYSEERKAAILKKLLPPHNRSVASVATEEGISNATLYSWLKQCREKGVPVPGYTQGDNEWSPDAKLAAVIETATMSETELGTYCRLSTWMRLPCRLIRKSAARPVLTLTCGCSEVGRLVNRPCCSTMPPPCRVCASTQL